MPLVKDEAGNEFVVPGPTMIGHMWGSGIAPDGNKFIVEQIATEMGELTFFYKLEHAKEILTALERNIKQLDTGLIVPENGSRIVRPIKDNPQA